MDVISGLVIAGASVLAVQVIASPLFGAVPGPRGTIALTLVLAVTAVAAFLAGAVSVRRARRTRTHLIRFTGVTGGVAGGLLGATFGVVVLLAALGAYASWPSDLLDQILLVLAYPALGAAGLCLGALLGASLGLMGGLVLRVIAPAR